MPEDPPIDMVFVGTRVQPELRTILDHKAKELGVARGKIIEWALLYALTDAFADRGAQIFDKATP